MQKMSPLLALGLLGAVVVGHSSSILRGEDQAHENETHVDSLRMASSNADFAFSLYKQLALKTPDKNVIFSPLSISMALAFVSIGARGTTLTEILEGLKFNLTETPEAEIHQGFQHLLRTLKRPGEQLQLSTSNAMFVEQHLNVLEKFREEAQALYGAEAFNATFQDTATAEQLINSYVEKKTQGKIADLVSGLDPQTVMVLVNYIFFKAKWQHPFDPQDTYKSKFHVSKGKSVNVPMMNIEDLDTPYFRDEELSCTVVELKYTGNASALFILPDEGKMKDVEAMLFPETLRRWRESLQTRRIDELYLPKFSISSNYNLEDVLPQLGMREVFNKQADLSGITGAKNVMVSQVVHKALIDVSEVGTEAAAATGVKITLLSGRIDPLIVRYNRPFLAVIISGDEGFILFISKIFNPKEVIYLALATVSFKVLIASRPELLEGLGPNLTMVPKTEVQEA
ncbi:alpha-1-antichymotrypsin [Orycteropus afer afer]|uniref:Alpha-1-antichymotrypsin n=1 Tax=Orycteropus afer afer TaxID=1230840 RepID=A0A8B7A9I8_ORYAF|nr:alpha-1-antichymotrypsin [Orycteropus afer afer]